eukprot:3917914-Amphidinium_carterae.1
MDDKTIMTRAFTRTQIRLFHALAILGLALQIGYTDETVVSSNRLVLLEYMPISIYMLEGSEQEAM